MSQDYNPLEASAAISTAGFRFISPWQPGRARHDSGCAPRISNFAPESNYVGSPFGPTFTSGGEKGTGKTGKWAHEGQVFYLQHTSGGLPYTTSNTLATLTVHVKTPENANRTGRYGYVTDFPEAVARGYMHAAAKMAQSLPEEISLSHLGRRRARRELSDFSRYGRRDAGTDRPLSPSSIPFIPRRTESAGPQPPVMVKSKHMKPRERQA